MKTPRFWNSKINPLSVMLAPLGWLYALATTLRIALVSGKQAPKPVICVGNLTAGGSGKTPVAISIARMLQDKELTPIFLSRGYGGTFKDVIVAKNTNGITFSANEVGDEPVMLAQQAPVIVHPDRYKGSLKAVDSDADVLIMDDGFQNPGLKKDLSFIVVDEDSGFGNGRFIPSGPLREPIGRGIKRADAILLLSSTHLRKSCSCTKTGLCKYNLPVFRGVVTPIKPTKPFRPTVVAFAGIGNPKKFYDSLRRVGFVIAKTIDFPDHHKYKEKELLNIIQKAEQMNADIFTTGKDMVKIPPVYRGNFNVLDIEIKWDDEEMLRDFILKGIGK